MGDPIGASAVGSAVDFGAGVPLPRMVGLGEPDGLGTGSTDAVGDGLQAETSTRRVMPISTGNRLQAI
ncbi:MAG: hypothetical protein ACK2TZ_04140 [Anaerolineales bacterium]